MFIVESVQTWFSSMSVLDFCKNLYMFSYVGIMIFSVVVVPWRRKCLSCNLQDLFLLAVLITPIVLAVMLLMLLAALAENAYLYLKYSGRNECIERHHAREFARAVRLAKGSC